MKLQELQDRISEWSSSLGGSLEGKLEHLLEEVRDLQRNPYDIEAQVDVYILMCAISAETGFNIDEITQGIDSKQNINEAKEWNPPDAQGITRYKKNIMKLATEFKPNYTRQNSDTSEILSTSGESVNIFQKVYQIIEDLDSALLELKEAGYDAAVADNDMRRAKAQAFLKGVGSNATARESSTDHLWQDARLTSSIAENRREVALEVVRSYRQKLSAIQSVLSAMKSEADVVKYGQNTGA